MAPGAVQGRCGSKLMYGKTSGNSRANKMAGRTDRLSQAAHERQSSASASSSSTHADEAAQRPFSSTSKGVAMLAHDQSIRLRDKEMAIERDQRQRERQARWEDIDDVLESFGLLAGKEEDSGTALWWDPSTQAASDRYDLAFGSRPLIESGRRPFTKTDRAMRGKVQPQYDAPATLADHLQEVFSKGKSEERLRRGRLPQYAEGRLAPFVLPGDVGDGGGPPVYSPPQSPDETLALLLPLLILLSSLVFLLLIFVILVIFVRRRARIALTDGDGPLDVGREEELEGMGGLDGIEERWLETVDDATRRGYLRAKDWTISFPPGSQSSEITLSQFLSIQEKGVSAWSFDPDYENNPSVFVEARTEITFMADGEGMAPQEGGGCSVQSNLPLPKLNDVYYWEAKMFTKPETSNIAVGLSTKPYPHFRMPGWSKYSVGFFSSDGFKCHNYPFAAQSYGPAYIQGDVIGVGYRPRSGTVFFTRNGKKLEDAFVGLNRYNLFPTIGADGAAEVHVNLGQAGFVFIEANVKKWGLAPMVGTLAPPPAYGMERGSILIETGQSTSTDQQPTHQAAPNALLRPPPRDLTPPPPLTPPNELNEEVISTSSTSPSLSRRARARRNRQALQLNGSNLAGANPSQHVSSPGSELSNRSASPRSESMSSTDEPHNPPTPHHLDISLHSLDGTGLGSGTDSMRSDSSNATIRGQRPGVNASSYFAHVFSGHSTRTRSPSPPPYSESRPGWPSDSGSLGGTLASHNQARRGSGRSHSLANALFGALAERGLLTPLSANDGGRSPASSARQEVSSPTGVYERSSLPVVASRPGGDRSPGQDGAGQTGWLASWFR